MVLLFLLSPEVCTVFSVLEFWLQFCSAELSCYIPHICMSSQQQPANMRCGVSFSLCLCPTASAWVTRQWTWTRSCFGPQWFMAVLSPPAVGCLSHTLYLFLVKGCMLFFVYELCVLLLFMKCVSAWLFPQIQGVVVDSQWTEKGNSSAATIWLLGVFCQKL